MSYAADRHAAYSKPSRGTYSAATLMAFVVTQGSTELAIAAVTPTAMGYDLVWQHVASKGREYSNGLRPINISGKESSVDQLSDSSVKFYYSHFEKSTPK